MDIQSLFDIFKEYGLLAFIAVCAIYLLRKIIERAKIRIEIEYPGDRNKSDSQN